MNEVKVRFRVFFEEPFWVGLFERHYKGKVTVSRFVFGPEPRAWQIAEMISARYHHLEFSPPLDGSPSFKTGKMNPKRRQRSIGREMRQQGGSTLSQQALQMQRGAFKEDSQKRNKLRREEEAQRKFLLKQAKRKEKKRGH